MNEINNYIVLIIYGSLVAIAFLLLTNPLGVNRKANFCFGIFLALWSSYWIEEIFILCGSPILSDLINFCILFLQSFTPILFYLSVTYFTNPDFRIKLKDVKYLVVPILILASIVLEQLTKHSFLSNNLEALLVISQSLVFITLSHLKINQHKNKINLFNSNKNEIDLRWIEFIVFALLALSAFIGLYNVVFNTENLNIVANVFVLFIVYFVGYNALRQKEIFTISSKERALIIETCEDPYYERKKLVPDYELDKLKFQLSDMMSNKEPFLNPDLKLEGLAQSMMITPHQLSYVINKGFNENFFQFINRYRVDKVKELLLTEKFEELSIMGIAYESGFNSKTSFNTTFKKFMNQTPSQFRKMSSNL